MKPNQGNTGLKEDKALWKKGSAYLPTKFSPVVPVVLLLNRRLGLIYTATGAEM